MDKGKDSSKRTRTAASKSSPSVTLDALIAKVSKAQQIYATYSQEKVDKIFKAAAAAANRARISLAQQAVKETGRGLVEDKVIKNHFAAEYIYHKYKDAKTCGIIYTDEAAGFWQIAEPLGVIAGIIPVTNPTSTVIYKALLALKTRNGLVISPHPGGKNCSILAAKIILQAAVAAGAPPNIIGWLEEPSITLTQQLITHPKVQIILATGGPSMVKAAYSSGKPALGVGAGNVPVVIDETADVDMAVSSIMLSKTFDHGMVCASEQALVVVKSLVSDLKAEFKRRGGYFLNNLERTKLAKLMRSPKGPGINAAIVGQSAINIAKQAGLKVPPNTKILISETVFSPDSIYALEKLSPILTLYTVSTAAAAMQLALKLLHLGGLGHTAAIYSNDQTRIQAFSAMMPAGRVLVNSPTSQGGIGDIFNFQLPPSLTLGCGSWGGNSVSENVGVKHLLNYKSVAMRRENMLWFRVPPKIYFKRGATSEALKEFKNHKRAYIVTDRFLFESGSIKPVESVLKNMGLELQIFSEVKPDPCFTTVKEMLKQVKNFKPDLIVAIGGGSPMDAAKILWLMYEHPKTNFEDLATRFMDIRKRIHEVPTLGAKAAMVAIPTTSGTGSEVTPFTIITDDKANIKYAIADYALTPTMAIVDPNLVDHMPKGLTSAGGIDALVHATESYVSSMATEFTQAYSKEAVAGIFKYLPRAYKLSEKDLEAREHMHYLATIAGLAFANAFLGVCHSMAHKIGNAFHIPHGIANALLFCQVIAYNANDCPVRQATFPQYKTPCAKQRYAELARLLGLGGAKDSEAKLVNLYIKEVNKLKKAIGIPGSIRAWGVKPNDFKAQLDKIVELAFDDQCTGANPVYPLMDEIRQMLLDAYEGKIRYLSES